MAPDRTVEIGTTDLRAKLADVLNDASVYSRITYVTSRGRRIAAIVPVPVAEDYEERVRGAGHDATRRSSA